MKHRKLRIAWSVSWGAVAALLCAVCVRAYWWGDIVAFPISSERMVVVFSSIEGIYAQTYRVPARVRRPEYPRDLANGGTPDNPGWLTIPVFRPGGYPHPMFGAGSGRSIFWVRFPRWFSLLIAASIAALPWLPYRFSLRTLLVATTLVAAALGTIVWMSRT